VVSAYVPTGEADTARQDAKWAFLDAMEADAVLAATSPLSLIMGDLNVGHRELDIRNWKGNVKSAGSSPGSGLLRPVPRRAGAESPRSTDRGRARLGRRGPPLPRRGRRPYTWWSSRGKAFDNDTGWRIDYHLTTSALAERVTDLPHRAGASWDTRWSDHAPVIVDYTLGV
jgi:exodeoxyribonuclease-3